MLSVCAHVPVFRKGGAYSDRPFPCSVQPYSKAGTLYTRPRAKHWDSSMVCTETASSCPWVSAAELEVSAWQLLCCWYITPQCPDFLQCITPYLIWSVNPCVPIDRNLWSLCKVLKGHIFYWCLLLTSSSWAKPTHARCLDTREEPVSSHWSITPSPAVTSPPEPPSSHAHTDRRYLYLPPRERWGLILPFALIMLNVIMGTLCHC